MMFPTVHLNGTSGEQLREKNLDACHAISKALVALAEASPNARDFYVQGNDAFNKAAKEHQNRWARLQSVYDELSQVAENIQNQVDAREAQRR
jgi:hypothetical protein